MSTFISPTEAQKQVWPQMFGGKKETLTQDFFSPEKIKFPLRVWGITQLVPSGSIGEHSHLVEQELIYVISGSGSVTSGAETTHLSAGCAVLTGPNESHSIQADSDGLTLFVTIIPC